MYIGSFYCPPHSPDIVDTVLEDPESSLVSVKQKYPKALIILGGDFNCPSIDWQHGTLTESYTYIMSFLSKAYHTITRHTDVTLVTFPTRAQNTLDLLFTTHPDSFFPVLQFQDKATMMQY